MGLGNVLNFLRARDSYCCVQSISNGSAGSPGSVSLLPVTSTSLPRYPEHELCG